MAMNNWRLTRGANTVTLPAPASYETREEKAQALDRTAAGSVRAYDKDHAEYRARVTWEDLSSSEKADLAAFFHNDTGDSPAGVNGVMNTFTLQDHEENAYTARFAEPELKFETADVANRWDVTVEFVTSALLAT